MARKILVVEYSPTQAERVRLLLESAGYEVAVARNGREGLQSVEAAPCAITASRQSGSMPLTCR